MPQEVLRRDLPLLRGSRLHGPSRRARGRAGWSRRSRMSWRASRNRRVSTSPSATGRAKPAGRDIDRGPDLLPWTARCPRSGEHQDRSLDSGGRRSPTGSPADQPPLPRTHCRGRPRSARYSFEEVFAEKLRAMGERGRPRDLYDIVNLYWRPDLRQHAELVRSTLEEKCRTKGVPVPTIALLAAAQTRAELETEWLNMLGHQLPALPPFEQFWGELPGAVRLARRQAQPELLRHSDGGRRGTWLGPPPTVWTWGAGVSLETVRFAAANRLCRAWLPAGRPAVIEPYSLRRSARRQHAPSRGEADTSEHRSYRVDRMESVRVTTRPFRPDYAVEFSSVGALAAPLQTRRAPTVRRPARRRSTAVAQRPPFARVD